jgi:hypothetical protein
MTDSKGFVHQSLTKAAGKELFLPAKMTDSKGFVHQSLTKANPMDHALVLVSLSLRTTRVSECRVHSVSPVDGSFPQMHSMDF